MVRVSYHRFCRSQSKFEIRQACYLKLFNCASLLCNYLFIRNALPIEIYIICMKWIIFWTVEKIWTWTWSSQWNEQPKRLKNDDLSSLIFSVSSICSWKYDLFQFINNNNNNNNNNDNNDNNNHHHSVVMIRVTMIMMLMIIIIIMILKMKIIIIKKKTLLNSSQIEN